ncbi:MAG: transcriptional regulator [Phycisphaerae bacterium]
MTDHLIKSLKQPGRYAYEGLNRVIHEKARLSIIASLAGHADGLLFSELKEVCSLTDGNLSRHLTILQEAGLIEVWKRLRNNRSLTLVRMTSEGRRHFLEYLEQLEQVIADAEKNTRANNAVATLRPQLSV